jgi:hypothetical protein
VEMFHIAPFQNAWRSRVRALYSGIQKSMEQYVNLSMRSSTTSARLGHMLSRPMGTLGDVVLSWDHLVRVVHTGNSP